MAFMISYKGKLFGNTITNWNYPKDSILKQFMHDE